MTSTDLVPGQVGDAIDFDGANDYMALRNINYTGAGAITSMSVGAWVNTTFTGGNFNNWAILDFDRSEYFNFFVGGTGNVGFSTAAGGIDDFYAGAGINDGNWHYLTAVFDGTNKYIYIDGLLAGTQLNPHGGVGLGTATTRYGMVGDGSEAISFNATRNNLYYDGMYDELQYSSTAWDADWIQTNYNNQNAPSSFVTIGATATPINCGCEVTYQYHKEFVFQAAQVSGGSPLVDFTALIAVTDPDLRNVANGGNVQNINGYDIQFRESGGATALNYQIEKYVPTTGELVAWVKIPTLSNATNTTIEMHYGNASVGSWVR